MALPSTVVRPTFHKAAASLANAPEPTIVSSNDKTQTATLNFHHNTTHANGKISHTHLNYTVVKRRNAHCPSSHLSVLAINCLASRIRLVFANATEARAHVPLWPNGTIFFIRHEWGCGPAHVRRFTGAPKWSGRFLIVNTVNTSIVEAFEHANISFFSNHSAAEGPIVLEGKATPIQQNRRRSWLTATADALFGSVSNAATSLLNFAVTGDLNINTNPFSTQYSLPTTPFNDGNANGQVSINYAADLSINTNVQLVIASYSLSTFSATVTTDIDASFDISMQAQGNYQGSNTATLTPQTTVASGTLPVFGVQIPINLLLEILGSYQASGSAYASLSASASVTGTVVAGYTYSSSSGSSPTGSAQYTPNFQLSPPQYQVTGTATAAIVPQISLSVGYVGSAVGSASIWGEADLTVDSSNTCSVSESVGAEVDVGSSININIPGIYSYTSDTPMTAVYGPVNVWTGSESC